MPLAYPPFKSCPCGSGRSYGACCGPAHDGSRPPATPEALMRARYTAYALGNVPFVLHTWHASTRPSHLDLNDGTRYMGLRVHTAADETVEFTASLKLPGGERYSLRERSRFEQVGGAWVYVDGKEVEG
ncbi:YchJ family protein [Deinococcus sp. QL22]|uniref:YchJ family protein n=1 Tax=Deinococcus sp. QL22 TaxID=2939437 RepID=UPI002016E073|nr:YchJ family metal-binding protein [Deinococcus sp. QL22]UQN06018.1 YchJ family metal-binding protein [Deinococcus sp. QL22]